jgi:hypothetical protein
MKSTIAIYRHSAWAFMTIPVFAVLGFWPTYFAASIRPLSVWDHVHGLAMFAWTFMLIAQALFIRRGRRDLHRVTGRLSYGLVAVIVVSTLALASYRLNLRGLSPVGLYVLVLQVTILLQFVTFYALAIRARARPDVHARFMICTALPLIDPIFARILGFYLLPQGSPIPEQVLTFALTDMILIALIAWDWHSMRRRDVFLPMLPVLLVLQSLAFLLPGSAAWLAFARWFMQLPLS